MINTDLNNRLWDIDIMGSWMEMGMAVLALAAGFIMVLPIIKIIVSKKAGISTKWNPVDLNFRVKNQKIQDNLAEIRLKLKSGRTCLLQFHNGGTYLDGSGIKKFSLTHESCETGISETSKERQDVLMTQYLDLLSALSDIDASPRLVSELDDNMFKRHLENMGTTIFAIYPVTTATNSKVVGMVLVEWTDWEKIESIDDGEIERIIVDGTRRIEPQLQRN